jgi:hypothetical protein
VSRNVAARRFLCLAFLAACVGKPVTLVAQARAQITPFFTAFFAPLPYAKDVNEGSFTADERLSNAPGLGLRIAFPLSQTIGIEAQGAYVWTGRQTKSTSGNVTAGFFIAGNALMASGRLTLHPHRSQFRGILGFGWQQLGGDGWDEGKLGLPSGTFDKTSVGGIAGFGVRASVTPKLALDLTVESYLHSSDPAKFGSKEFQADINLTVGVPISLGH